MEINNGHWKRSWERSAIAKTLAIVVVIVTATPAFGRRSNCSWKWESPLPVGADLLSVTTVGEHGFIAVGAGGAMVHSADGGQSWETIDTKVDVDLNDVIANGTDVYTVGSRGLMLVSRDAGKHWSKVMTGTGRNLNGIWIDPNGQVLIVGDRGTILLMDAKNHSLFVPRRITTHNLRGVSRIDDVLFAVGDGGTALHSRDGRSWTTMPVPTSEQLNSIVGDRQTILLLGVGLVAKSDDKGKTWQVEDMNPSDFIGGVSVGEIAYAVGSLGFISHAPLKSFLPVRHVGWSAFDTSQRVTWRSISVNSHNQVVVVGDNGAIARSVDDGKHWRFVHHPASDVFGENLNAVLIHSASEVYAAGTHGVFLRWEARSGWQRFPTGTTQELLGLWETAQAELYLVGRGKGTVLRSTDRGTTWNFVTYPDPHKSHWFKAVWGRGDDLFLVGSAVLYSSDRGQTWIDRTPPPGAGAWGLFGISGRSSTDVYVVGMEGAVFHSRDRGLTWTKGKKLGSDSIEAIWADPSSQAVIAVGRTIFVDRHGNGRWREALRQAPKEALRAISGTSRGEIIAGGLGGGYYTSDRGITWNQLDSPGSTAPILSVRGTATGDWWLTGLNTVIVRGSCLSNK